MKVFVKDNYRNHIFAMKIFNHYTDRDEGIKRMVQSMIEIDTCYKNGLVEKGLGCVIIQRNWKIEHNPLDGWHRSKRITYQTIQQLERFKSVPIDVIGINDDAPASVKNKSLIDLINEYGSNQVISAELAFDPFWFNEPKNPGWRFFRVLVDAWNQPDIQEMTAIFTVLDNVTKS